VSVEVADTHDGMPYDPIKDQGQGHRAS